MRARRIIATAAVILGVSLLGAGAALAQATPDEAVSGLNDGIFIEPGAESVDTARLAAARAAAAEDDIELSIVVLADSTDAVAFAQAVSDRITGTVLVFTPTAYGAASTDLSQGRMNDALRDADDALSGDDIATGAAVFVDAAVPAQRSWGLIITVGLLLLALVAVVGRVVERRATAGRRAEALATRWAGLQQRADAMSDPVIELSTKVEIDGRPELAERFRDAASRYGELTHELGRSPEAKRVDALDAALAQVEGELGSIRSELTPAG